MFSCFWFFNEEKNCSIVCYILVKKIAVEHTIGTTKKRNGENRQRYLRAAENGLQGGNGGMIRPIF